MGSVKLKPAMQKVYTALTTMKFGASALDNINQDLMHLKEHEIIYHDHSRLHLHKHLQLVNVHFTYNGTETHALNAINLTIVANTTVGIMGSTGAGKSTFVDLILGLLQPDSGSVLVDNTHLNQNNIRQWQNSIGYVPQEIFLADDSVSNNIAFGVASEDIDANQVEKAARMAQIHDFILTLQHGYQTMIGERGVRLSGGQKQRLAIARALYHDPDLLILDEATSALDNYTEKEVMKAIDKMSGTRTIIMIAHRLTTLANCDKVILLDNGQISKIGQYEGLVKSVGL
jgi:ABC-type multidrug transport system fused ATPase/permease subunit